MQVAVGSSRMDAGHVCTLDNAQCALAQEKHHQRKLQILYTVSASEIFKLIDGRNNTTSTSHRGPIRRALGQLAISQECYHNTILCFLIVALVNINH